MVSPSLADGRTAIIFRVWMGNAIGFFMVRISQEEAVKQKAISQKETSQKVIPPHSLQPELPV